MFVLKAKVQIIYENEDGFGSIFFNYFCNSLIIPQLQ